MVSFRQSTLASFETCPRRTWHTVKFDDHGTLIDDNGLSVGNVAASADLGSAFHAVAAAILRTLRRQGERQMPTQEAVEVMYEVVARGQWVLPADERDSLRMLVLRFASDYQWDPSRLTDRSIEQRLSADLPGPDGEVRTITGQPDVLMFDPPSGLIIIDYKTGWSVPPRPRQPPPQGEPVKGKRYLSERGHFQLDVYGLLALRTYPAAQYVTLRELHLRSGEVREATLERADLEHVERELGTQMMLLSRAISEGPDSALWNPRPGAHCARKCPVSKSCPIPAEQRGAGAIDGPEQATQEAGRYRVVDALRQTLREQLKVAYETTGQPIPLGDGKVLRKEHGISGTFGIYDPPEPEPNAEVEDYTDLLAASVAQVEARRSDGSAG